MNKCASCGTMLPLWVQHVDAYGNSWCHSCISDGVPLEEMDGNGLPRHQATTRPPGEDYQ